MGDRNKLCVWGFLFSGVTPVFRSDCEMGSISVSNALMSKLCGYMPKAAYILLAHTETIYVDVVQRFGMLDSNTLDQVRCNINLFLSECVQQTFDPDFLVDDALLILHNVTEIEDSKKTKCDRSIYALGSFHQLLNLHPVQNILSLDYLTCPVSQLITLKRTVKHANKEILPGSDSQFLDVTGEGIRTNLKVIRTELFDCMRTMVYMLLEETLKAVEARLYKGLNGGLGWITCRASDPAILIKNCANIEATINAIGDKIIERTNLLTQCLDNKAHALSKISCPTDISNLHISY